ncbi:MAG: hypothetical protein ABR563_13995, partial [Pyrinomonadaceae bacterium]
MKRTRTSLALALACALVFPLSSSPSRAQIENKPRGVTPEDYFSFEFVGDPQLSPDGKSVAYVVTTVDQRQNRRFSNVWIAATDGSRPPRPFTAAPQSSNSPRWSPDGRALAFLSARPDAPGGSLSPNASPGASPSQSSSNVPGATQTPLPASSPAGSPPSPTTPGVTSAQATASAPESPRTQVYLLPLDGGEARRVTNLRNGVSSFRWSPDGTRVVLLSRTGASDVRPPSSDVRHYEHPSYKFNDTGWFDDRRSHLFVVDVPSGAAKQITSGDDWNDTDPQWSP